MCLAIIAGAFPDSTFTCASVALFITSSSAGIVNSLVYTFAFTDWDTLVQFFVDCLSWKAVASGNAFLSAGIRLNLSASLSATLSAFLIDSTTSASHGAASGSSPVGNNFSIECTLACVGCECDALNVGSAIYAARACADILLTHGDVLGWIDNAVAATEHAFSKTSALIFGSLKIFAVLGA
jgi:hypothetical protein